MKGSYFQRHLIEKSYSTGKPWSEQVALSSGPKPVNAEFEQWTTDLSPNASTDTERTKQSNHKYVNGVDRALNGSFKGAAKEGINGQHVNGY